MGKAVAVQLHQLVLHGGTEPVAVEEAVDRVERPARAAAYEDEVIADGLDDEPISAEALDAARSETQKQGLEIPDDSSVLWIEYKTGWYLKLVKELEAANFEVDANKLGWL